MLPSGEGQHHGEAIEQARQRRPPARGRRIQGRGHEPLAERRSREPEHPLAAVAEADERRQQQQHPQPAGRSRRSANRRSSAATSSPGRSGTAAASARTRSFKSARPASKMVATSVSTDSRGAGAAVAGPDRRAVDLACDPGLDDRVGEQLQQRLDLIGRRLGRGCALSGPAASRATRSNGASSRPSNDVTHALGTPEQGSRAPF